MFLNISQNNYYFLLNMENIYFVLIGLLLFNALGNIKGEPRFSKEYLPRESPRSLEDSGDNYILVEYGRNFTDNLKGFVSRNGDIKIAHIYKGDEEKDYIDDIKTFEIEPGAKLRLVFSSPATTLSNFFYYMTKIKSIDFSHFDSTNVEDMSSLFEGCNDLETITFGDNFDTTKVTRMNNLFSNCFSLLSIDLSKFNTESVFFMDAMFYQCNSLTEINLKNFRTINVIVMTSMFDACSSLRSLDLSSFNTKKVTYMDDMFYRCSELTSINFGDNFNSETLLKMDGMFSLCVKLTSLDLSKFYTASAFHMMNMFYQCSSLVVLDISNFIMKPSVEYGAMFRGVTNLKYLKIKNIQLGKFDFSNTDLNSLANLTVCKNEGIQPFSNTTSKIFRCCETPFDTSKCNDNYIIVEYSKNFTDKLIGFKSRNPHIHIFHISIDNNEIDYINDIQTMEIKPGSKLKIEFNTSLTTLRGFFFNMTEIKSIDFSHFDSTEVTDMFHLFDGCTKLQTITFGDNFNTTKVTNMHSLFNNCSSLTSIDLSKFNTELVTDMRFMFFNCNKLTEINLKNFKTINLETIGYIFGSCSSLSSLDLSSFNTKEVAYMYDMFNGCSELTSINFGSYFNTEKVLRMDGMFYKCEKLTSLDLSKFNTTSLGTINGMFSGCSSLVILDISNFNIKNAIMDLQRVNAFFGVNNLKYLHLMNIELGDYDLSDSYLEHIANLTICKKEGAKPFSNTTSKIFRCCETPFDTSKCNDNYIIVEYSKNFTDKLIGFKSRNPHIHIFHISIDNNEIDYINDIQTMEIKPGSKLKIEFNTSLTTLRGFFFNMTEIKSIDFSHFDSTEVTDMFHLFDGCTKLQTITFGDNFNTTKVTNMHSLFNNCSSLTSIDLSKFNTVFVNNMSYLFSECNSLESINFSNIDTSSVVDMSSMFYNCSSLKLSELFNFNTKKVTNMSSMFYGCSSIQTLNLTNFDTSSLLNMKAMFRNSNSLVTLDISTFNTRKVTTMAYLFAGCSNLKNLYHMSVLDSPSLIDKIEMYDGCDSLFSPDNPDFRKDYNGSSIPNDIVLLGFNKYKLISNTKKIVFNIYFYSYEYFEFPQSLTLSASIIYNSQLRLLQNENNVECIKGEDSLNYLEKYECEIDIENTDIKTINLNDSIDFGTGNNLIISPLASEYINNLQNLQNIDSYDDLFDKANIFLLQNSKLEQDGKIFNVSGRMIDDPLLPIGKKITLLVKSEKEQSKDEINCNVADNDTIKYTLNCNMIDNTITYDLNNSMSVIDTDILIINFEDGNSITNKSDNNKSNRRYYFKSNSGISSGAIVAIILCPILSLASVIAIIYFTKNNSIRKSNPDTQFSSTECGLK